MTGVRSSFGHARGALLIRSLSPYCYCEAQSKKEGTGIKRVMWQRLPEVNAAWLTLWNKFSASLSLARFNCHWTDFLHGRHTHASQAWIDALGLDRQGLELNMLKNRCVNEFTNMYSHEGVRKQAALNYYYLYVVTLIPYPEISGIGGNLLMKELCTHMLMSCHLTC